jgi:hypothetical protein
MRRAKPTVYVRKIRNPYTILIENTVRERPVGRRKWKDNIKTNLTEMECKGVQWIHLVRDMVYYRAIVKTVMNLRVKY